ncbi:MAG: sigma-70 family RNA polymerase sigma factor [Gemmataceae bacterium]|nr:sigma-70 family RNA polymerase sigma factor [Gemmataceae bacterium]MCI0737644.1 sigma-70 family RNA polymerase sigma factor [Gemmataceae bacterium]
MQEGPAQLGPRVELLYYFCRLQIPSINLSRDSCGKHLERTFEIYRNKAGASASWNAYLDNLYPLDWFVAAACLEGNARAWEALFASRAGRSDCLLLDALRARAARLYPRDEERQDSAVTEFWSQLYVPERPTSLPVLARYDGNRPLVPWLIRVFQNWHISQLRKQSGVQALPEDDLAMPMPANGADGRWREVFAQATRDWLEKIGDDEVLLLGLRLRYRLSQREVANLLEVHEGTISRRTDALRDQCLEFLGQRLVEAGWSGDDLSEFIRGEMHSLLLDDPRLSVDYLAHILAKQGKKLTNEV